jgi:hypothetical protein
MKKQYLILIAISLFITFTACSDNSTSADGDLDALAVALERTGEVDVKISQGSYADENVSIRFCYEGEGCEEVGGGSTSSWGGTARLITESSESGKVATGVIVEFQVDAGEGFAEVLRGDYHEEEDGWERFIEGPVVKTSDPFSAGDIVSFHYGDTE